MRAPFETRGVVRRASAASGSGVSRFRYAQTYLLGAMLLFGSSNGVVFLYRFWRGRQEAREQAKERRRLKLSRNEFGAL